MDKIIVLDGAVENPGDLSWEPLAALGELTVYDYTAPQETIARIGDAPAILTNKTVISAEVMAACPNLRYIGVLATGYNVVDIAEAKKRGIVVTNVPAYSTDTVAQFLPPVESQDFYRITLTGYSQPVDTAAITAAFPHIPNLEVRDRTRAELDLWSGIDEDTLEGTYFKILHDGLQSDSPVLQRRIKLAARISRQILDGQEVVLP